MQTTTNDALIAALSKAYAALCALNVNHRAFLQDELCACRDALALAQDRDAEEVQDEAEELGFQHPHRIVFQVLR
jgi:oligoendopeptidase F